MTIALGASGATSGISTATPTVPYPAGITAEQKLVMFVFTKLGPTTQPAQTGWTSEGFISHGVVASGNDAGSMRGMIYTKDAVGNETGTFGLSLGVAPPSGQAWISRYTKTAASWGTSSFLGVVRSETTTAWSITGASNPGFSAGDYITVANAAPTDLCTDSSAGVLTAAGATFSAPVTVQLHSATAIGTDCVVWSDGYVVNTGPSSDVPTYTSTLTGGVRLYGVGIFFRLRESAPPTAPTTAPTVVAGAGLITVTTPSTLQGDATSYSVYRDGLINATSLAANATYNDTTTVKVITTQTYTVRGVNGAGESSDSPLSTAIAANPVAPSFVLTPAAAQVTVDITLKSYAAVYKVYRAVSGGSRVLVHTSPSQVASGTYTWIDTGRTNGITYDYHVITNVATPTVRDSSASSVLSATPSSPAPTWSLWNGTTEETLTVAGVWNGTTIDPPGVISVT